MERRKLGKAGPEISVVGYGAWEAGGGMWGPQVDEDVLAAMEAGIEAGMNWIDTAEIYGRGRSEELVGKAVRNGHRDEVLILTKYAPFSSRTRRADVGTALRASLDRLGVDHVDLYQIHWLDEDAMSLEEQWEGLAEAQDEGLTRHIGVSNFDQSLIERCQAIRHVDSVQNQFSLLHQEDRTELLPWAEHKGIGYLAYGPLAFGLLTGAITRDTTFGPEDWRSGKTGDMGYYRQLFAPGRFEWSLERVERLRPIAERLGIELSALALRALIDTPGVTAAIAGSRNADHVRSNARAGDLRLAPEVLEEIQAAVATR